MKAKSPFSDFARKISAALILGALTANGHGAPTALGTEPFTLSGRVNALPNVMFVLDDSGSMKANFLPDWAGPYLAADNVTVLTPAHRFFNGSFNGVAYNPGTYYSPPVMYDNTGARDNTTYPSMSGQSTATGGDGTASAGSRNWKAVKVDGYGIQSVATVNLEGNAFSYTTVAGEHCTNGQLRSCTASATPTGSYTFPSKLRWCTTAIKAADTTANAGTACQASNIADTPTNTANGVTNYTFARMPRPRTATITVTGTGTVSGITVDTLQILSASAAGGTTTAVATAIAANINACTLGIAGNCAVVGYSASSATNVVTVTAPGTTSSTPAITGGTASATAFSGGNVPGNSLFTVITPTVTSYPYPGTAAKGPNRVDCAGSTCTYTEEMTNYANWYAYYRTRMQMMKSGTSVAFSTVDANFRVGYVTINNGAGADFLNPSAFDGGQKHLWYSKLLGAVPFGQTPLREALANTGRLYAGKLSTFNGVAANDPMQYSCQQNFAILSTDGYWKQAYPGDDPAQPPILPKQIDGTTDIGQQDHNDPRPYYDGGTQTRTTSQTLWSEQQIGIHAFLVESRTQQQQTSTSRLTQSVITTNTYPWQEQTTTLRTRTTPLNLSTYKLESRTYPLKSDSKALRERTYLIDSTTWPLQSTTYNLTKTTTPLQDKQYNIVSVTTPLQENIFNITSVTTPLQAKVFNITSVTTPLQEKVYNITSVTTPLQAKVFNITSVTTPLQEKVYNITSVTTPLQAKVFNITSVTTPLQEKVFNITSVTTPLRSSTYKLQASTRQLQAKSLRSIDGGDTYQDTGWVNTSSCTTTGATPVITGTAPNLVYTKNTQCQYATAVVTGGLNSCTAATASASSPYTVGQAVTCSYETTPTVAEVTTCTAVAQSGTFAAPQVTCAYSGTPVTLANETTCTPVAQSTSSPYTGPARTCTHNATAASTTDVTTCTPVTPNPAASVKKTCGYTGTPVTLNNQTTCATVAQSGSSPYAGPARTCTHSTTAASTTDVTTCTASTPNPAATPKTTCGYTGTPVTLANETTCTTVAASPGPTNYTGPMRTCTHNAAVASTTDVTTCTPVTPNPAASVKKTCGYTGTPVTLNNQTTCATVAQSGSSPYAGPARTCTHSTTAASTTDVTTCTASTPNPAATPKTTCTYTGTPVTLANETTCTTVAASPGPTNYTGPKRTCTHNAAVASTTDVTTCTPVTPNPAASVKKTCGYTGTPVTLNNQTTCATVAQSGSSPYAGPARTCTHSTTAASTTDVTTCTASTPNPAATPKTTCTYTGTPVTLANETTCTPVAASAGPTNYTGPTRTCTHNATAASSTTVTTCTSVTPNPATTVKKTCTYTGTPTTLANQTTCTSVPQSGGNPYTGPARTCTFETTPALTTDVTSCTAVTPANAATPKHTCTYTGTPATLANQTTCTTVAQSTANTYTGPAVACAYTTTPVVASNQATCTAGTASTGPVYNAYSTCAYVAGATTTGQSSCTVVPQSTAPNYSGPANTCAYSTSFTGVDVTSCTPVAQSPTFAAPQKTCVYATTATTATNLTTCTDVPQSTSAPYVGPNVACYYATTASATNLNAGTCDAVRSSGSPYTGPAVDCNYNATPVVTNNVAACTTVPQSSAPNYVGPAVACAYGSPTGYANAAATCNYVAQSTGPSFVGPARDCTYSTPSVDTLVGTCTEVPQSTGPAYTQLVAKHCVAGSFPVVSAPVVTTVDACSTDPTSTGSPVVVSTTTTCAYQAPVTVNTPTCTVVPVSAGSPYVTAVDCPVTDTGYVPVAPTCTPAGTPPLTFDGTGKVVECRNTDSAGTSSAYAPTDVCSAGTDGTTKLQTNCSMLRDTTPIPVDPPTCTATVGLPVAPDYIKTICTPSTATATVMGCSAHGPSSPLWDTVTCADDGSGTQNTLADVAAYYYKTDLRTPALNNCSGAIPPLGSVPSTLCSASLAMNNVPTTAKDPNSAQHMTTFTLGLGVSGYMKYSDSYLTDTSGDYYTVKGVAPFLPDNGITADPANGICSWQSAGLCNWPFPVSDEQTAIDDLWHAGVNGHGAYFSATDPDSLASSIAAALAGVAAVGGSSSSPTISNPSLTPGDSYVFSSTYTTVDWTGELVRRKLDPITGAVSASNDWSVQAKLDAKAYTSRNIYTYDATVATTQLKPFTSANFAANTNFLSPHISTAPSGLTQFLCASTEICLSATDQNSSHAAGANLVNFLRGDRTHEGAETDNTKYFRQRLHVFGDVVNAQVVYVNKPLYNYVDPGYADSDTSFVNSQSSRLPIAYASSNDGMLHAFHAKGSAATEALVDAAAEATDAAYRDSTNAAKATAAAAAVTAANAAVAADTTIGQEAWAFIPSMVLPELFRLADKKYKDKHRYYVDGTPVVGDICISHCSSSSTAVWKTILVGGLGRGGRGYYALDITDPTSPKALWEFTDVNLGYTFGNPQIGKTADGLWVVLLTSGYNNIANDDGAGGDGVGRLYMLDAATGTLIREISTGVGDTTTPSGLAKITAQVVNPDTNNLIEAVYGGDLLGNLWRFDINNSLGDTGFDAQLLAVLKDGSGNRQRITTKPQVSAIPLTGEKIVYVGTGSYLHATDAENVNQQTLYAIKVPAEDPLHVPVAATAIYDNPGGSPRPAGTTPANSASSAGFVRQTQTETECPTGTLASICSPHELVLTSTTYPVDYETQNGWFIDLIGTGERANTDPALALGELVVNTNLPSLLACDVGGSSNQYFLNFLTGGPIGDAESPTSPIKKVVGKLLTGQLASSPTLAVTKAGKLISITGLSGGGITVLEPPLPPGASIARRTSWRELIRE